MGLNSNHNQRQDIGDKNLSSRSGIGATRSTASSQSVSTNGSVGSPSTRVPSGDTTFSRLNHFAAAAADDAGSQATVGNNNKKKRGQRATGGDKNGRGLRQFSMKVCEKVESRGRTTYNVVADELVAEFADPGNGGQPPDQTRPHATVEVEISEDMQLVHFYFNSTPFEIHDDNYVLKAMKLCDQSKDGDDVANNVSVDKGGCSNLSPPMFQPRAAGPPTSLPIPGILKARVKHEP